MSIYFGSKESSKQTWDTGTPLAELIGEQWCSMSQYGYILSEHRFKMDAIESARSYYRERPTLEAKEVYKDVS